MMIVTDGGGCDDDGNSMLPGSMLDVLSILGSPLPISCVAGMGL